MDALRAMASFCRERQIAFVAFVYRGIGDMSKLEETLLADISKIGGEMDFDVVHIKPWKQISEKFSVANSTIDPHPNGRGHAILAGDMADYIMANVLGLE